MGERIMQKALLNYVVIDEIIMKEVLDTEVIRGMLNLEHYIETADGGLGQGGHLNLRDRK